MNEAKFDNVIHAPSRLQICAILAELAEVDFQQLKQQLNVSDSVLSKHLKSLEETGYIFILKKLDKGRVRTWLSLTDTGHTAFNAHVLALRAIIDKSK